METIKSLLVSPSFWFMIAASTIGGILVIRGLIIENNPLTRTQGERLVITGVCLEVFGAVIVTIISGVEVTASNEMTARIGTTNAWLVASNIVSESNNLILRSKVAALESHERELELTLLPVSFTNAAASSSKLSVFAGAEAEVEFQKGDACAFESARVISSVLNDAKWKTHEEQVTNNEMFNSWVMLSINVPRTNADPVILSNACDAAKALETELLNNGILATFEQRLAFDPTRPSYEITVSAPIKFGAGVDFDKRKIFVDITNRLKSLLWPPGFSPTSPTYWPTNIFKRPR